MSTMIFEVFDAFRSAGVPEDKAKKAAEAISNETTATKDDVVRIERELAVIKWMLGAVLALAIANFAKQYF